MKILAIGDPHFMLNFPYGELIEDGRRAERAAVLSTIHAAAEDCDTVVLMGDNLDKRHNHSSVIRDFTEFLDGFGEKNLVIISGNHETYEGDKTALDFLINLKESWRVVTPENAPMFRLTKEGVRMLFVPYMTNAAIGVNSYGEAMEALMEKIEGHGPLDVVFIHHAITESKTSSGKTTELFDEIVLPRGRLEAVAKIVVAGHVHNPQAKGRTIVTGNMFTHDVGNIERFVWKVDTDEGTFTQIPLPVRPIYKLINPVLKNLDVFPRNAIVKAILTEKGQDVEALKAALSEFDAHILLEQYPDERTRLTIEEGQTLDLSVDALLELYAKAKEKDVSRLRKAFTLVKEA